MGDTALHNFLSSSDDFINIIPRSTSQQTFVRLKPYPAGCCTFLCKTGNLKLWCDVEKLAGMNQEQYVELVFKKNRTSSIQYTIHSVKVDKRKCVVKLDYTESGMSFSLDGSHSGTKRQSAYFYLDPDCEKLLSLCRNVV